MSNALPPQPGSLTRSTLIKMAVRIAIVIVVTTLISYWHIISNLEGQVRGQLEKYITERGQREGSLFLLAEDNHALLKAELLRRLEATATTDPQERFSELFYEWSDGTVRNAPEGFPSAEFDTVRAPTVYIGREAELDDELRRRILVLYDLTATYGPAWRNRFVDTYIMTPENIEFIYWPEVPWGLDVTADLYIPGEEFFFISDAEHNPRREPVWTSVFEDPVPKIWMVSLETPVDDATGRHVATIGHDIILDELLDRIVADHLEGSYNLIFREDGRLIVHPDYVEAIQAAGGQLEISQSGDAHLQRIFEQVVESEPGDVVLDNRADDEFLAFTRIAGPEWYLVTVYPKSLLNELALETARFILLLGLLSLAIEITVLYFVLRQQVEQPLQALMGATEQVAAGNFAIELESERPDELGRLASLFNTMAGEVSAREEALNQHRDTLAERVKARTQRLSLVASLGERLGAILDPDDLLHEVVTQLERNFGYYQAQIYLLDEKEQRLVLAEGTGEAGAALKAQGFAIPLETRSLVARAARTGQIVREDDVQTAEEWLSIDLLPETRSEVAVPIVVAEQVVGVLDVQSEQQGGLDDGDADLLRSLANQVAVALTNARLFEQSGRARARAEVANQAKSEFLSNMSHELRTPLNAILGYTQILRRERELTPLQVDGLRIIEQSGEHLLTLINDILDLSKIEAQRLELEPSDLYLPTFLNGIVAIIRMRAQQKGLTLNYEAPQPLPRGVRADEKRLRQVLINLLGNAVKFTEQGTVTMRVTLLGEVGGTNRVRAARLRFEVIDTGVGIPTDKLEAIFLPFEQAGDARHRGAGTGLGLPISRKLVQAMGGDIQVESSPGQGSTFWFEVELPLAEVTEEAPTTERQIIGYQGAVRTVLVVDDKEYNRSVMVNLLAPLGFEVLEAVNGKEAVEQATAISPDLIVMDMVMPVMTGFEATQEIRKLPALANVVIFGASASVFESDKQQVMLAGCDTFLPKPIHAPQLYKLLESYLKLEWVYEEALPIAEGGDGTEAGADEQPLVAPPAERLKQLLDLARMGDLRGLQKEAHELERNEPLFAPFAQRLQHLAKRYEEKEILSLIQHHLNGGEE